MNWLPHILGIDTETGRWYAFWSGFGSDIGQVVIIGGLLSIYRKHNCHVHGCWRLGRHPVEGTAYVVCRRHHPDGPVTRNHVFDAHRAHKERATATATAVRRLRGEHR
jgi:hypothetical protein